MIQIFRVLPGLVVGAVLVASSPSGAQPIHYRFSTFAVPGAAVSGPMGINNQGQIVGAFNVGNNPESIGFVRSPAGSFVTVRYPGAQITYVTGINNRGVIAGYEQTYSYSQANQISSWDGFTHAIGQPVSPLGLPFGSVVAGINRSGEVVGFSQVDSSNDHGFLRDSTGHYTPIYFASPNYPNPSTTQPMGINDLGAIVGWFTTLTRQLGFIRYRDGSYGEIVPPFPFANLSPSAINNYGVVVGGIAGLGFVRDSAGVLTVINVPGANGTVIDGINDHGVIVGNYFDSEGSHAFIGTPLPP